MSIFRLFIKVINISPDENFSLKSAEIRKNKDVTIRPMKLEEFDRVAEIYLNGFRNKYVYLVGEKYLQTAQNLYIKHLKSDKNIRNGHYVAMVNNEIKGICRIRTFKDPENIFTFDIFKSLLTLPILSLFKALFSLLTVDYIERCEKNEGYVDILAVDNTYRGKGIGQSLLSRADEECYKRGCTKISLLVVLSNFRARRLYEKHGYVPTKLYLGRRIFLFGTEVNNANEIIGFFKMEKNLEALQN
ncbi:DgyrCDS14369 [Dimorphilus gyrociliatus]|uniref:DgyrCDS14369 n=1 Tax=Dimorphilus gyrociliatus TaxID=2664684 RepID=A0A7I8WDK0_9ANNE|nr:DgyrCDS14369 [Dimorphilus gyrociliatus]